ncbi:aminomethyl-transferring glycine dehydrogenase subunit GcvPA [Desulfosarcina ovata]|uniref:Probable glycine dehydrogenase (decarboxylating) subunit 1 n=1 Tax=Desulfosarcina ovata subsp. ovata TaxID=2752305 RepID=A0A5K8ADP2_9BACT|nr:aminomethyl-transferring glycine dehydrogenase subunit GcvPA [Desulfosarcina ovata]BBO90114.1 glycine dehydrogenase [Desulfosarcina ovata subsp. ovata]
MRYLPHTPEDIRAMLQVVGAADLDALFASIPDDCRRKEALNLPEPLTEWELNGHMDNLAAGMGASPGTKVFMGAGSYHHHIPEVTRQLLLRGEYFTAYTPYQPEISQGTLQTIYEYQSLVCRLLGMDVANASMYDGASGLAEALLMTIRVSRRKTVAVSRAVHPLYRRVVETYFAPTGFEVVELPVGQDGRTDLSGLKDLGELAGVALQSPNFFGCIEDMAAAGKMIHADPKTLFVAAFSEPLAFGMLKSPGECGADIACGEGQSLGIPQSFGGPGLGMFASRQSYVRSMPGRLIGKTVDRDGKTGFVLTLATREQHIRREKATSNICSNQGLCATASTMYMAALGGTGIRQLARLNRDRAEYLKASLAKAGFSSPFSAPTFNEFVVRFPDKFEETWKALLEKKMVAGLHLEPYYPELSDCWLMCVTETIDRDDMDTLVKEVTR